MCEKYDAYVLEGGCVQIVVPVISQRENVKWQGDAYEIHSW
jgi:hypothetical protein